LTTIVHWFRRDLRLDDNTALSRAARDADRVVPVFVLDDHYGRDPMVGPSRLRFLRDSLVDLDAGLRRIGGRLVVRPGPASRALPALLAESGAEAVYANAEIGPYPERRDREAESAVASAGGRLRLFADELVVAADALSTAAGDPFTVFTPFSRRWLAAEKGRPVGAPAGLGTPELSSVPLSRVRAWRDLGEDVDAPRGGEAEARVLLSRFFDATVETYAEARNLPGREGTSRLSPHLHFGTISARTVRTRAGELRRDASPVACESLRRFELELAWRDFYHHVLLHFPRVASGSFRPEFDRMDWRTDAAGLEAWKLGRTGYPIVDAAMRQLSTTHWMHNRARMIAASFLTKDLHVHWREGEAWFEQELADADLANNNGGWQWAAGSGTDAAPYFRIFNPVLQSKKFDPDGRYIRRFVPELARVPDETIHEPWTMTLVEQRAAGCAIGKDYPAPIVDHAKEREVALAMFKDLAKSSPPSP